MPDTEDWWAIYIGTGILLIIAMVLLFIDLVRGGLE